MASTGTAQSPEVRNTDRICNEIDHFLLAKVEQHGLSYSDQADRNMLVRRAYFNLTGAAAVAAGRRCVLQR
jgi:hypothetical protein